MNALTMSLSHFYCRCTGWQRQKQYKECLRKIHLLISFFSSYIVNILQNLKLKHPVFSIFSFFYHCFFLLSLFEIGKIQIQYNWRQISEEASSNGRRYQCKLIHLCYYFLYPTKTTVQSNRDYKLLGISIESDDLHCRGHLSKKFSISKYITLRSSGKMYQSVWSIQIHSL